MNTIIISLSIITDFLILLFCNTIMTQELGFLIVYLAGVIYFRSLDIMLPIFFIASFLPLIKNMRSLKMTTVAIYAVFTIYLIYGLFFQSFRATSIAFISRCWCFLVFFLFYETNVEEKNDITYNLIPVAAVAETAFAFYLFATEGGRGAMVRLVAGSQPVCGNIAISILPIVGYLYYKNKGKNIEQTKILLWSFYLGIWVALSGTRGYILIYAISVFWILVDYFFATGNRKIRIAYNRLVLFAISTVILILIFFLLPGVVDKLFVSTRLGYRSTGIRKYENRAMYDFFIHAPFFVQLFGVGLGGRPGDYTEFVNAISKQASRGMWNINHYLYGRGTLFHNIYINILCMMGIVGIFLLIVIVARIRNRIVKRVEHKGLKRYLLYYLFGFLLMNWFRWSTDCGIHSMIVLALVLQNIKTQQNCMYN